MLRPFTLPVRLAILVAGTMLPLIAFSGTIIYSNYLQDRKDAQERVLGLTRSLQQVLDREMQGMVSGLTVLASSRALRDDDLESFRRGANAFVQQFKGASLLVANAEGRILFSTTFEPGVPIPQRSSRPNRDVVYKTAKPTFSPLFIGAVTNTPIVTVTVPVIRDGKVVYDLSFNPPLSVFQQMVEQRSPGPDWTVSIFDQTGVNFARIPNPERTVGQRASPTLYAVLFSGAEGQATTTSLEGVPLITAFTRSELTGWVAAAGVAETTLVAPALKDLLIALGIGIVLLGIGLAFALRMAGQITRGEALHALLINELNHRVKNTLATVQSMAAQTFRGSADADARHKFNSRLVALGAAHDLLSESKWAGADLRETLEAVLAPFQSGERIRLSGPAVRIDSRTVTILSMVIQELATNASKYGALLHADGRVLLIWELAGTGDEPHVILRWVERDGPPVKEPLRSGFGSTLIQQGFAAQLGGSAKLTFEPDGLTCLLEFPLRD